MNVTDAVATVQHHSTVTVPPTAPERVFVPEDDTFYVPIEGDPDWWQMERPCTDSCHHPVHGFSRPQRLRHLVPAAVPQRHMPRACEK